MDEEDLEELRNSKTIVDQTEEMDLLSGTQGELSRRGAAVLPDNE
jgi:G patch domain-containing protein 1